MRLIDADKLLNSGYTDMFDEPIKFTNISVKAIEDQPTVEAIPIEWIYEWRWNNSDVCCDKHVSELFGKMLKDWKKETVDVIEVVRHGKWEQVEVVHDRKDAKIQDWQQAKCSVCGRWHTTPFMYYLKLDNYCPNCGAKMEERKEDAKTD